MNHARVVMDDLPRWPFSWDPRKKASAPRWAGGEFLRHGEGHAQRLRVRERKEKVARWGNGWSMVTSGTEGRGPGGTHGPQRGPWLFFSSAVVVPKAVRSLGGVLNSKVTGPDLRFFKYLKIHGCGLESNSNNGEINERTRKTARRSVEPTGPAHGWGLAREEKWRSRNDSRAAEMSEGAVAEDLPKLWDDREGRDYETGRTGGQVKSESGQVKLKRSTEWHDHSGTECLQRGERATGFH